MTSPNHVPYPLAGLVGVLEEQYGKLDQLLQEVIGEYQASGLDRGKVEEWQRRYLDIKMNRTPQKMD